jgi:hypothetical protein
LELSKLFQFWQATSPHHRFSASANEEDMRRVEAAFGFRMAAPLRELYLFSNGLSLFRGDLKIYPLLSEANRHGMDTATTNCRGWFHIPSEVVVFGDNGSDEHYGFWTAQSSTDPFGCPIIEIGQLFIDPACMSLAATDLLPFLYGETVFSSLLSEIGDEALDILELPQELRVGRSVVDNKHFARIRRWADPGLPDPDPEPYTKGLDSLQIRSLLGVIKNNRAA